MISVVATVMVLFALTAIECRPAGKDPLLLGMMFVLYYIANQVLSVTIKTSAIQGWAVVFACALAGLAVVAINPHIVSFADDSLSFIKLILFLPVLICVTILFLSLCVVVGMALLGSSLLMLSVIEFLVRRVA